MTLLSQLESHYLHLVETLACNHAKEGGSKSGNNKNGLGFDSTEEPPTGIEARVSVEEVLHKLRWVFLLKERHADLRAELLETQRALTTRSFCAPILEQPNHHTQITRPRELATFLQLAKACTSVKAGDPGFAREVGKQIFQFEQEALEYCLQHNLKSIPGPLESVPSEFAAFHARFWSNYQENGITSADLPATYYKAFFNKFFEGDLYGRFRSDDNLKLSTGALDQDEFAPSMAIKYAIEVALKNNWVGYSHSLGRSSARMAISNLENVRLGRDYFSENHIVLTLGVTAGLSNLLSFLIKRSDEADAEVLTHLPNYASFIAASEAIAETRWVDCSTFKDFEFSATDLISHVNSKTRVILLLSDRNPVGCPLPRQELEALVRFCDEHQIYLVLDEAGERYPADKHLEGFACSPYLIRMDSLSKKCGIPGMKLGYFVADPLIVEEYYEHASTHYGGPASFFYLLQEFEGRFDSYLQQGVTEVTPRMLEDFDLAYGLTKEWLQLLYDEYRATRAYYDEKIELHRNYVVNTLHRHVPNLISQVIVPKTGINVFCKVNYPSESYLFFRRLLSSKQVAVFPGVCSGKADGCWIRITVSTKRDILTSGLQLLIDFLKEEFVKRWYESHATLKSILVDLGRYTTYPRIDFHTHLYDVYEKAVWLAQHLAEGASFHLQQRILRDAVLCHDAGKVISVLVTRAWRVLRLQRKYPGGVPEGVLKHWRDEDLLYNKEELRVRSEITHAAILDVYPLLAEFEHLLDWQADSPPRDTIFTSWILTQGTLHRESKEEEEYWQEIKGIVGRRIEQLDTGPCLSPSDIYVLLIDLADKLADADVHDGVSSETLTQLLEQKMDYVIWRYASQGEGKATEIQSEFGLAKAALLRYFRF